MHLKSKSLVALGIRVLLVVNSAPTLLPCKQGTFLCLAFRKHFKKSIRGSLQFSHPLGMVIQQLQYFPGIYFPFTAGFYTCKTSK